MLRSISKPILSTNYDLLNSIFFFFLWSLEIWLFIWPCLILNFIIIEYCLILIFIIIEYCLILIFIIIYIFVHFYFIVFFIMFLYFIFSIAYLVLDVERSPNWNDKDFDIFNCLYSVVDWVIFILDSGEGSSLVGSRFSFFFFFFLVGELMSGSWILRMFYRIYSR